MFKEEDPGSIFDDFFAQKRTELSVGPGGDPKPYSVEAPTSDDWSVKLEELRKKCESMGPEELINIGKELDDKIAEEEKRDPGPTILGIKDWLRDQVLIIYGVWSEKAAMAPEAAAKRKEVEAPSGDAGEEKGKKAAVGRAASKDENLLTGYELAHIMVGLIDDKNDKEEIAKNLLSYIKDELITYEDAKEILESKKSDGGLSVEEIGEILKMIDKNLEKKKEVAGAPDAEKEGKPLDAGTIVKNYIRRCKENLDSLEKENWRDPSFDIKTSLEELERFSGFVKEEREYLFNLCGDIEEVRELDKIYDRIQAIIEQRNLLSQEQIDALLMGWADWPDEKEEKEIIEDFIDKIKKGETTFKNVEDIISEGKTFIFKRKDYKWSWDYAEEVLRKIKHNLTEEEISGIKDEKSEPGVVSQGAEVVQAETNIGGGAKETEELVESLGIDLNDPNQIRKAIELIKEKLSKM